MKNAAGRAIQNMNLFMIMFFLYFFIRWLFVVCCCFLVGLEMSLKTCRFGVVIALGSQGSFVCLFGWFGFLWARGTLELLECGCVSVLGWAVSLICCLNLRVALQQREPNFSPSSSLLLLASYDVSPSKPPCCPSSLLPPLPLSSFFLVC